MTAFPIFYAVIENDLRRVLAYSLNNQLGFMVVGIGIGTELAINGTAAHAFSHILYKGLLFMSVGGVLFRTGTAKGSDLGALYKSMPWTCVFCIVGAASISVLLFASAGVFHHSGIKIPYFAFFGHDSGHRVPEAPRNMLVAMGVTAVLCIGIGVCPGPLYRLLPYDIKLDPWHTYSLGHVITQLQLLIFSALAFTVLMRTGIYPPELRSVNLDTDWIYRRPIPAAIGVCRRRVAGGRDSLGRFAQTVAGKIRHHAHRLIGSGGLISRTWSTAEMVFWVSVLLGISLVLYYL